MKFSKDGKHIYGHKGANISRNNEISYIKQLTTILR
jgi:hypothetical protein